MTQQLSLSNNLPDIIKMLNGTDWKPCLPDSIFFPYHGAPAHLSLSHVRLFATPWTVAHQDPLSMGFPRQGYRSGLPFSASGDLPNPEIESVSPGLAGGFFTTEPPGKPPRIMAPLTLWELLFSL